MIEDPLGAKLSCCRFFALFGGLLERRGNTLGGHDAKALRDPTRLGRRGIVCGAKGPKTDVFQSGLVKGTESLRDVVSLRERKGFGQVLEQKLVVLVRGIQGEGLKQGEQLSSVERP